MRIDVFFLESAVVYHLPLSKAAESARGRASSRRRPYRRGLATSMNPVITRGRAGPRVQNRVGIARRRQRG